MKILLFNGKSKVQKLLLQGSSWDPQLAFVIFGKIILLACFPICKMDVIMCVSFWFESQLLIYF